MKKFNFRAQSGIGHPVMILALVVITLAGLVGYRVWNNQQAEQSTTPSNAKQVTAPETISNVGDLDQTSAALEQATVDNDLNSADLEQDIQSLL